MEKISRYIAEVIKGDKYIKTGYKTLIFSDEVDKIIKVGGVSILLHEKETDFNCDVRRLYPCRVYKEEFELIETEELGETELFEPKTVEWYREERDWKDHWC